MVIALAGLGNATAQAAPQNAAPASYSMSEGIVPAPPECKASDLYNGSHWWKYLRTTLVNNFKERWRQETHQFFYSHWVAGSLPVPVGGTSCTLPREYY
ncbi:hypothetical protein [Allokutzneria multivorans]